MGLFDHSHSLQIEKSKRRSSFLLSLRSSCLLVPLYRVQGFTEEDAATTIIRERRPRETEVNGYGSSGAEEGETVSSLQTLLFRL